MQSSCDELGNYPIMIALYVLGLTTGQSDANSDLVACLGPILHCLICWTDKSQHFRTAFLAEGLIFDCIDMLNKLGGATQSKVRCRS